MSIERRFDVPLIAEMALREKQIQQNYRPIIGVHKWFARRPGTLFRGLLLAEFGEGRLEDIFFRANDFRGLRIADPFMGGGTPLIEANRIGCVKKNRATATKDCPRDHQSADARVDRVREVDRAKIDYWRNPSAGRQCTERRGTPDRSLLPRMPVRVYGRLTETVKSDCASRPPQTAMEMRGVRRPDEHWATMLAQIAGASRRRTPG